MNLKASALDNHSQAGSGYIEMQQAEFELKKDEIEYFFDTNIKLDDSKHIWLQALINSVSDYIVLKDAQGRWLIANDAVISLFQLEGVDYRGKTDEQLVGDNSLYTEVRLLCAASDKEAWRTKSTITTEVVISLPDSSPHTFAVKKVPFFNLDATRKGILIVASDITNSKQAQAQIAFQASLLKQVRNAVIATDLEGRIIYWNEFAETLYQWKAEEVIGKNILEVTVPENKAAIAQEIISSIENQGYWEGEFTVKRKDRSNFSAHVVNTVIKDADGKAKGIVGVSLDITDRIEAENKLAKWHSHLEELVESRTDELTRVNQQQTMVAAIAQRIGQSLKLEEILNTAVSEVQQILECDRVLVYRIWQEGTGSVLTEAVVSNWPKILGKIFPEEIFPETSYQQYLDGKVRAINDIEHEGVIPCLREFVNQFGVKAKIIAPLVQGDKLWGLLIAHQCRSIRQWQQFEINLFQELATHLAIAIQQASLFEQLEAVNEELKRQACIDGLTQVANRRKFDECLEQEWRRMAREKAPLALILCDVDSFKKYNDTYGHLAGDFCLQQVADAINRSVKRPADLVARYGGEEFAVILPGTKAEGAIIVAEEIRNQVRCLQLTHSTSAVSEYVTLSVGIAIIIPNPHGSPEALIYAADQALYEAKRQGRDRVILKTCR